MRTTVDQNYDDKKEAIYPGACCGLRSPKCQRRCSEVLGCPIVVTKLSEFAFLLSLLYDHDEDGDNCKHHHVFDHHDDDNDDQDNDVNKLLSARGYPCQCSLGIRSQHRRLLVIIVMMMMIMIMIMMIMIMIKMMVMITAESQSIESQKVAPACSHTLRALDMPSKMS